MKIVEEINGSYQLKTIEVEAAKYIGDYAIRIYFNDSTNRLVDFKSFLKSSLHPSIRKYLDESLFKQFQIVNGNLNWGDYDLIFSVHDLYEGKI